MMGEVLGWTLSVASLCAGVALGYQLGIGVGIGRELKRRLLQDLEDARNARSVEAPRKAPTDEDLREVMIWHLSRHCSAMPQCSYCGHDKVSVSVLQRGLPFHPARPMFDGGSVVPTISIICQKCSAVRFFAWLAIEAEYAAAMKEKKAA